jgi:transposase InsO family protein
VYEHELADRFEAQRVIAEWVDYYNEERPHSVLAGRMPAEAYRHGIPDFPKEVA